MNAIENITIGHTERLRQTCGLHDACQPGKYCPILPVYRSDQRDIPCFRWGSGMPLDTQRLWTIFILLVVYVFVMALAERASYRANFRGCL